MGNWEEKNNEDNEEMALFGLEDTEQIRILGCWLGPKADIQNWKKRAGY